MKNLINKEVNNDEIYNKNNGLYYTKVGDYYYPNIVINDEEKITLGKYGRARLQYLKSHKRGLWSELIMTEKLTKHLKDVDDFDKQLKELAPKIKRLNEDIRNLYMIERRTILWKKEADKAVIKEKQRLEKIEQIKNKGKGKKYVR